MLEVSHLTKIYSGKGGVTVKALDDVSVVFPEKGMVFLLGKSGSGKSTLLNVAGGLDKPDGGEVIVKGRSSKSFSGSDFDSYRNTFIGFIFQEYNILDEFTIEQNIGLALQLQNKPFDGPAIKKLLRQVDLEGYGNRKPNTLSGGQKQRVAIARALIKNPEIIMADEPTGALDSATGKQVFDTLKKLSEEKLVIVVSHDRDFAETYADRIIELKDGKIISDVTRVTGAPAEEEETAFVYEEDQPNVTLAEDGTIRVRDGEKLSDADLMLIGKWIRSKKGESVIRTAVEDMGREDEFFKTNNPSERAPKLSVGEFAPTQEVEIQTYDGSKTKFIKSHLPVGHAIKMGASGLKSKPIRLIFTILLAVAAFVLFGVASTFMLYDENYSVSEAMKDANNPAITLTKWYDYENKTYKVDESGKKEFDYKYTSERMTRFGASEVQSKSKDGLSFAGVFSFTNDSYNSDNQFEVRYVKGGNTYTASFDGGLSNYYRVGGAIGFSDCGADYLAAQGYTLIAGNYPKNKKEMALPAYLAEVAISAMKEAADDPQAVSYSYSDLIGKEITVNANALNNDVFTVSGVYNVGTVPQKFDDIKNGKVSVNSKEGEALMYSLRDYLTNSFHRVIFVHEDFYDEYKDNISSSGFYLNINSENYTGLYMSEWDPGSISDVGQYNFSCYTDDTLKMYGDQFFRFYDSTGKEVTRSATDIYLSKQQYNNTLSNRVDNDYWPIENNVRYSIGAEEEYNSTSYQNKKNNGKSESIAQLKRAFMNAWAGEIAYHYYVFYAAQDLYNTGKNEYTTGAFYAAYERIDNVVNNYWSPKDGVSQPTEADWTLLTNTVKQYYLTECTEKQQYYRIARVLVDIFRASGGDKDGTSVFQNAEMIQWESDETQYNAYKKEIVDYMTARGLGAIDGATPFATSDKTYVVGELTRYYYDRRDKGVVTIAGYYEIVGQDWGAEYFMPLSFMNEHATYVPYNGERQVTEYSSDYVAPSDEKYNYLISPTDNSRAQIASALAKQNNAYYIVQSHVYEELRMFLEMIKELEKIFLYVGLGVGLLASFFLLNFISVSISTKKKDIGILRAIGARGVDVFKIFFAEAFIISLICFVLASVASFILCFYLNKTLVDVVSMKLLNFGPINIGLIFGISTFVAVIATFFPVYFAARKSPVESIRSI